MAETSPIQFDFRSDTVTRPSPGMYAAMVAADVGDDVFGDDPTVNALEVRVAEMVGKAAGLLLPTGTMSNLVAIMSHCQRGDEYICGQEAHCYLWEAGGAAVLGSVQPQPLANQSDGTISLEAIAAAIKADDPHFAITRLITVENSAAGRVLPLDYLDALVRLARSRGLALHLDGARLFNAAIAQGRDVARLAAGFDTVSICLSKGLGAPMGSVLVGPEALIARARRWRKMLGGGMRQAGIVAAAGRYALDHNIDRLAVDHANARRLADGLGAIPGLATASPQTNMVFVEPAACWADRLPAMLRARGIAVTRMPGGRLRWVTHLDVDAAAVDRALAVVREAMASAGERV